MISRQTSLEQDILGDNPVRYEEPGLAESAPVSAVQVRRYIGREVEDKDDYLAVEEPLQIRLAGEDVAIAMRTPGHDSELALGFLYTENIIEGKHQVEGVHRCVDEAGLPSPNTINILPTKRELVDPRRWRRDFYAASSCGLCGKTTLGQVARLDKKVVGEVHTSLDILYSLPSKLKASQETFAQTGGLHAAALFDLEGKLLVLREDVGRHNAVDKVVGHALLNDWLPLDHHILLVSSRASFEIVQKALAASIPILAVISAPSSLAVETARQAGMTLVAFLREGRLNVYSEEERIQR